MTDLTDDLPRWRPRTDLDVRDLANTLACIRRMAWGHYLGGRFEPEHMHAIAAAAAQALCGQPAAAPLDMSSPEWKAVAEYGFQALLEHRDGDVESPARHDGEREAVIGHRRG